ncbi:SPOSA6832_03678 [Sporobolomyces salmonicolor]|uniref:SPOSA6832_03678-mRNA-1:cds n=1 Tax=Sporidiobolus salmonicolor TaxID=5005 RepID=A0A0D6EPC4_SPOSA|nr:SPOSA6832_03678 [Sporobolomyces salmonicolor]
MSNLIPSALQPAPPPATPQLMYTDCMTCRVTGTLTFSAVGLYALTVSRSHAKTPLGKGAASLLGLAARWTSYTPPPSQDEVHVPS